MNKIKSRLGWLLLVATTLLLTFGTASAAVIYTFDGDSDNAWIVDTDSASFTTFSTSAANRGYPVSVRDTIILADRDDGGSTEYTLAGVATGNTWPGGDNFTELLDGTTNGISANYGVECCGSTNSVTVADLTWENQRVLFDLPQNRNGSGIAFDTASGSLWVVSFDDSMVTNYSLSGDELGSFSHGIDEDGCCLAYDESDDTLWVGENESNTLRQYAKNGTLLDSVTIAGWSPGNQWSAEIAITGIAPPVAPSTPIPSLSPLGLGVFTLLLGLFGVGAMRRRTS